MYIEGSHPDMPVVFASNHQFAPVLYPKMIETKNVFNDRQIYFICESSFSFFMRLAKLSFIGYDSIHSKKKFDKCDFLKRLIFTSFGKITRSYKNSICGDQIVGKMVEILQSGNDLFLYPSGTTNLKKEWRSGLGRIIKQIDPEKVGVSFVYIPKIPNKETIVSFMPTFASLIPSHNQIDPREISTIIQKQYEEHFKKQLSRG